MPFLKTTCAVDLLEPFSEAGQHDLLGEEDYPNHR